MAQVCAASVYRPMIHWLSWTVAWLLLLLCQLVVTPPLALAQMTTAPVGIEGFDSGKCLSVNGASTDPGATLLEWDCDQATNSVWTLSAYQDAFRIISTNSSLCMNVYGNYTTAGTQIIQWPCVGDANELWYVEPVAGTGGYQFRSKSSNMCLQVSGDATYKGAGLEQDPCGGGNAQVFLFASEFVPATQPVKLVNSSTKLCAGTKNGDLTNAEYIVQTACKLASAGAAALPQQWLLQYEAGAYQIVDANSHLCLDVFGASSTPGQYTDQYPCSQAANQLWSLLPQASGGFTIVSQLDGQCLDLKSTASGADVVQKKCTGGATQTWTISVADAVGTWAPLINLPLVPVAGASLPNGQYMFWSSWDPGTFGNSPGNETDTVLYNPANNSATVNLVTNTQHDMFCPGTVMMSDGRLLVAGGNTSQATSIYNYASNAWTMDAAMNEPRGYQANVPMDDGSVFTLGGSWSGGYGGKNGELWTATGGWAPKNGIPETILESDVEPQGIYRWDNHTWMFATGSGNIFQAGPSAQMNWLNTANQGTYTAAGNRGNDPYSMNGNAVMYDVGKILKLGGAQAYQGVYAENAAYQIDINAGVNVTQVGALNYARSFANSVILPDGRTFVSGGEAYANPFSDTTAVLYGEIYNPATSSFNVVAPADVPRTYHSIALLMNDGRVLTGGGGLCGDPCDENHFNLQIYTPDYLYQGNGQLAVQPVIKSAPATATYNKKITVSTDRAVKAFSLMRLASVTHSVSNDQRRVPLTISSTSGTTYTVKTPANSGVASPGFYLLFALDSSNVPSVASYVQIK